MIFFFVFCGKWTIKRRMEMRRSVSGLLQELIESFIDNLVHLLGNILGTGDVAVNKKGNISAFWSLNSSEGVWGN